MTYLMLALRTTDKETIPDNNVTRPEDIAYVKQVEHSLVLKRLLFTF
jgi:hypothetical protein